MAFSKLEAALLAYVGISSSVSRSVAKATLGALGRGALASAPIVGRGAIGLAQANPALTGAALGLGALQTQPGQQLLDLAEERGRMDRIRFEQALTDLTIGVKKSKARTSSKFNKMVSAGMKTLKASTSYGKKGTISNSKKAFAKVTTTASKILKGGKTAKSGITRKLGLAMRRFI